jgi:tripartite-type tricarboxylate transporter receptor subunit TctC
MKKVLGFIISLMVCASVYAWPTKPITLVIPYPAGGTNDQIARNTQRDIESILKVTVNVVNIPGAGNMNAINHVLNRDNDDHTFIISMEDFITGPLYLNSTAHTKFTSTNVIGVVPYVLYGNSTKTVDKLKKQIKAKELVNVGNNGVNGGAYLFMNHMQGGLRFNLVPYKGAAPLILDVIGGHVEYGMSTASAIKEQVDAGKIVPLMISGERRSALYPNVPTMKELGFKNAGVKSWFGVLARQDTSKEALDKFSNTMGLITANNEWMRNLSATGMIVTNLTGDEAAVFYTKQVKHFESTKK